MVPPPFPMLLLGLLAALPRPAGESVERHLAAMGTALRVRTEAPERGTALAASEAAVRALEAVEARLSTWRAESELARLNRAPAGEPFDLSAELAADLALAAEWWRRTDGAFDPGVGALVDAWDLRGSGRVPAEDEIGRALAASGLERLELRTAPGGRGAAVRLHPDLRVEEGAFGKGIGLDAALAAAREAGAERARVDLGGQIAWFGGPERVAVAHPLDRERLLLDAELDAGSVATSGNGERGLAVGGEPLGHLIDPRTGRPAADFGSVTVWAPDAAAADCLSTALFVMGPDGALSWASERGACEVLVLEPAPDGSGVRARATPGFAAALRPRTPDVAVETVSRSARAAVPASPSLPHHPSRDP